MDPCEKKCLAVKVIPNVWIGGKQSARNNNFFKEANIKAVLNMTPSVENTFKNDDIEYMRIPIYDSHEKRDVHKMYAYLPSACEFIYKNAVIEKKNVLVHCILGRQRSSSAVAAYMIKYYNMTPIETMEHLLQQKKDVFAYGDSVNFAKSLNKWYRTLRSLTNKQTSYG